MYRCLYFIIYLSLYISMCLLLYISIYLYLYFPFYGSRPRLSPPRLFRGANTRWKCFYLCFLGRARELCLPFVMVPLVRVGDGFLCVFIFVYKYILLLFYCLLVCYLLRVFLFHPLMLVLTLAVEDAFLGLPARFVWFRHCSWDGGGDMTLGGMASVRFVAVWQVCSTFGVPVCLVIFIYKNI